MKVVLARVLLGLLGVLFAGMGLWFLIAPDDLVAGVFLSSSTPAATIELATYYGGSLSAIGIWWLVAALRRGHGWHWALGSAAILNLTLLACRSLLMLRIPSEEPGLYTYGTAELICGLLAAATWALVRPADKETSDGQ